MVAKRTAGAMGLVAWCAAGCTGLDHPTGPDLSALAAIYDAPDGQFDETSAAEITDLLGARFDELDSVDLEPTVESMLDALRDVVSDDAPSSTTASEVDVDGDTITIEGEAFLTVRRICDGWTTPAVADEDNGTLTLRGGLTDAGLDRSMWVDVERCRYLAGADEVVLEPGARAAIGDIRMNFGERRGFSELDDLVTLVEVDVTSDIGGAVDAVRVDFRLSQEWLESRIEVSSGNLIVATASRAIVLVRAANGTFSCEADRGICVNEDGDEVPID